MRTIKITPNLLFEYQCTSGKFIRLPNRIESKLFLPELECSNIDKWRAVRQIVGAQLASVARSTDRTLVFGSTLVPAPTLFR